MLQRRWGKEKTNPMIASQADHDRLARGQTMHKLYVQREIGTGVLWADVVALVGGERSGSFDGSTLVRCKP